MKITFEFRPRTKELLELLKSKDGKAVSEQFVREYNSLIKNPDKSQISSLFDAYSDIENVYVVSRALNIFAERTKRTTVENIMNHMNDGSFIYSCKSRKPNFKEVRDYLSGKNFYYVKSS